MLGLLVAAVVWFAWALNGPDQPLERALETRIAVGRVVRIPELTGQDAGTVCVLLLYRKGNEIERLFRRLKGFRRVFTRYDKLDVLYRAFVHLALIIDALR